MNLAMRPLPHPICEDTACKRLATHELLATDDEAATYVAYANEVDGAKVTITVTAGRYCHAHATERVLATRTLSDAGQ